MNKDSETAFAFVDKHGRYVSFGMSGCTIEFSDKLLHAALYGTKESAARGLAHFYDMTLISDAKTLYSGYELVPVQLSRVLTPLEQLKRTFDKINIPYIVKVTEGGYFQLYTCSQEEQKAVKLNPLVSHALFEFCPDEKVASTP